MASKRPTAEWVLSLYQLRKGDGTESALREQIASVRELVTGTHVVSIPKQYQATTEAFRSPFPRDALNRIAAALLAKPPVEHITPRGEKADARAASSIGERWDQACMEVMNTAVGADVVMESARALVRDAESVIKVVHVPDAWANFPERGADEEPEKYSKRAEEAKKFDLGLPFAWRLVDRLSMLFGNGEYGDDWAIEYGEYPKPYLSKQYGMAENVDGRLVSPRNRLGGEPAPEGYQKSATGYCTKVEYWDADWWAVVIDGSMAPGFPKENPYRPKLPYFRATLPDGESMLAGIRQVVPHLDAFLTMKRNHAHLNAYPTPVLDNAPGALNGLAELPGGDIPSGQVMALTAGKLFEVPMGKVLRYMEAPTVGADLNQMVQMLIGFLDIAGVPSVMRGVTAADASGYLFNQAMAAASMPFKTAVAQLGRQLSGCFEFIHWLVDKRIGQTVYVLGAAPDGNSWLGLKPGASESVSQTEAPVSLLGPITWSFRPQLPTDEQARAMVALQLTSGKLLDRRTALEKYLQEEDPDSIIQAIWADEALSQDPLRSIILQEALRKSGMMPVGTGQNQGTPPAAMGVSGPAQTGMPSVPGAMPVQPGGGRAPGMYPGMPPNPPVTG